MKPAGTYEHWKASSSALALSGILLNYVVERHSFLKLGSQTTHNVYGGWSDVLLPALAFMLTSSGVILFLVSLLLLRTRDNLRGNLLVTVLISVPLGLFYGDYYLAFQFMQTGSDTYGECFGLEAAANSSNEVPPSLSKPGTSAVGCSVERYGMFFWPSNVLVVYGVTDAAAQKRIVQDIRRYKIQADTFPVRILFYEKENWTVLRDKTRITGGERGPENLIRVVVLH